MNVESDLPRDRVPLLKSSPAFAALWFAQASGTLSYRMFHMGLLWASLEVGARWDADEVAGGHANTLGSGMRIAFLLLASALPSVVLAKWVGQLVEKLGVGSSLRWALSGFVVVAAATVVILTFAESSPAPSHWASGPIVFGLIVGASLLSALCFAPFEPGIAKGIGRAVPQARVGEAVAWQTSTQSLANFGGAVAGASLLTALGVRGVLVLAICLCVVGLFGLHAKSLKGLEAPEPPVPLKTSGGPTATAPAGSPLRRLYPREVALLAGFGGVNFFATPLLVLLPLLVRDDYGGDASILGLLEGAMWVGLLAGSIVAGRYAARLPRLQVPFPAVLAMGFALMAGVAGAQAFHVALHVAGLLVFGLALGINNTCMLAHFQTCVVDADKGRFFAMMQGVVGATFPIGYLVFGVAADAFGARGASYVQGAGLALCALPFLFLSRWGRKQTA